MNLKKFLALVLAMAMALCAVEFCGKRRAER